MSQISQIKKIYHAAIYVRLSKEDGAVASHEKTESNSIANQKSLIRDFLENKNDIEVVQEYVDDGFSGSNFERPAFQMMLEDIKKGKIDCVVTKDLSRFGREYIDSGMYIERLFPAMGVRFIAINDGIDSGEAKSQSDEIIIPFKNLINDAYCRDISIKIRSHLEIKRKQGDVITAFVPYGYKKNDKDKHKLEIDVYAANVVKDIFRMKLHGKSQDAIACELNSSGILPPAEYKASTGSNYQTCFKTKEKSEWTSVMVRRSIIELQSQKEVAIEDITPLVRGSEADSLGTLNIDNFLIKTRAVSSDSISHSTARYSYNPDGRCGSVAGAIVLNYYDRYKSPSYVPNSLESSDGVALINALVARMGTSTNYIELKRGLSLYIKQYYKPTTVTANTYSWGDRIRTIIGKNYPCILGLTSHPRYGEHWVVVTGYNFTSHNSGTYTVNDGWGNVGININSSYTDGGVDIG